MENSSPNTAAVPQQMSNLQRRLDDSEQENVQLKSQLEALIQAFKTFDFAQLLKTIEKRHDASDKVIADVEKHIIHELIGRYAGLIEPYLEKTASKVAALHESQGTVEGRVKNYHAAVEKIFVEQRNQLIASINTVSKAVAAAHEAGVKNWTARYGQFDADLSDANKSVKSLAQTAQRASETFVNTTNATISLRKMIEQWTENEEKLYAEQLAKHDEIQQRMGQSLDYSLKKFEGFQRNYKKSLLATFATLFFVVSATSIMTFIALVGASDYYVKTKIDQIATQTAADEEKIRGIMRKAVQDAHENQLVNQAKIDIFNEVMQTIPPQQKNQYLDSLAERVKQLQSVRTDKKSDVIRYGR